MIWLRLKQDIDRLREILLTGPKSWGELRQLTKWVNSVLKQRIDFLEKLGELKVTMGKRKGRRTPLYMLSNEEKTQAKRAKYASIEFIEALGTPVYARAEKGKATISAFISPVGRQSRESLQKIADNIARKYTAWALQHVKRTLSPKQKIAVVLTVEG